MCLDLTAVSHPKSKLQTLLNPHANLHTHIYRDANILTSFNPSLRKLKYYLHFFEKSMNMHILLLIVPGVFVMVDGWKQLMIL